MKLGSRPASFLPKLDTGKFEQDGEVNLSFKSGASFIGNVTDYKKVGSGVFTWPNGAKYTGEFVENKRQGKGVQEWADNCMYDGDFSGDVRHGTGKLSWSNGETFEGEFFRDRRHHSGTYSWPDGSTYTGSFYMDRKEGYGKFTFANGEVYEGLYKDGEREGPGVLTYPDGRQDVGLWHGEKLVKICTEVTDAFTMKDHPEFDYKPEDHVLCIDPEEDIDKKKPFYGIINPPSTFNYLPAGKIPEKIQEVFSDAPDPRSLAVNREAFDKSFFTEEQNKKTDSQKIQAWNRTPLLIDMQKHVYKNQLMQNSLSYNVDSILNGDRSKFKERGPLELSSEALIRAASAGDIDEVENLLCGGKVSPDVSDKHGHMPLIAATVNWHMDVINCLLNHGANVNKLNDEGSSALSAGIIFFYPISCFHNNIAENGLEKSEKMNKNSGKTKKKPQLEQTPEREIEPVEPETDVQDNTVSSPKIVRNVQTPDKLTAGVSSTSIDSGIPNIDSYRSSTSEFKQQDKISDSVSREKVDDKTIYENGEDVEEVKEENVEDRDSLIGSVRDDNSEVEKDLEDFESNVRLRDYQANVSEQILDRCATHLTANPMAVKEAENDMTLDAVQQLALQKSQHERMKNTLDLLLRRGADPNASGVPMPVLFFAIKAADVEMVRTLLMKGASTNSKLPGEKGGLAPLHIAVAIPGEEGVQITELLLDALADPDARADEDDSFLNLFLEEEWAKDAIAEDSKQLLGGRTPLQIACARDDNYKHACKVVHLLLRHKANSSLLCNGFSPLALAITSGNDLAVDELLLYGANPSLRLTHGVGTALCVASSTEYEHRRPISGRIQLIDKLMKAGADILTPIAIGPKRLTGTAVDYGYYMYNQDRRIAHMPYHALTHAERETYNARRKLLEHLGDILRTKAVEREKVRLEGESREGRFSDCPSSSFVYVGAGAAIPPGAKVPRSQKSALEREGHVTFHKDAVPEKAHAKSTTSSATVRKPLFKYCYECGRSVFVRLSACTRCKEVYYCSKACKLKAWNIRHKEECIRVASRSRSPSPTGQRKDRTGSPAGEKGKKGAVVQDKIGDKGKKGAFSQDSKNSKLMFGGSGLGPRDRLAERYGLHGPDHTRSWSPPPGAFVDNYSNN